jgi:hypothetical protein
MTKSYWILEKVSMKEFGRDWKNEDRLILVHKVTAKYDIIVCRRYSND